jgi:hypothetical protein
VIRIIKLENSHKKHKKNKKFNKLEVKCWNRERNWCKKDWKRLMSTWTNIPHSWLGTWNTVDHIKKITELNPQQFNTERWKLIFKKDKKSN